MTTQATPESAAALTDEQINELMPFPDTPDDYLMASITAGEMRGWHARDRAQTAEIARLTGERDAAWHEEAAATLARVEAEARATQAEAALAASEERVRAMREANDTREDTAYANGVMQALRELWGSFDQRQADAARAIEVRMERRISDAAQARAAARAALSTVATGDALPTGQTDGGDRG